MLFLFSLSPWLFSWVVFSLSWSTISGSNADQDLFLLRINHSASNKLGTKPSQASIIYMVTGASTNKPDSMIFQVRNVIAEKVNA